MRKIVLALVLAVVGVGCFASNFHCTSYSDTNEYILNGEDETTTYIFQEDLAYEEVITHPIQLNDLTIELAYIPKYDCYGLKVPNGKGGYVWCPESRNFGMFEFTNLQSGIRIDFEGETYIFWYEDVNPFED